MSVELRITKYYEEVIAVAKATFRKARLAFEVDTCNSALIAEFTKNIKS